MKIYHVTRTCFPPKQFEYEKCLNIQFVNVIRLTLLLTESLFIEMPKAPIYEIEAIEMK